MPMAKCAKCGGITSQRKKKDVKLTDLSCDRKVAGKRCGGELRRYTMQEQLDDQHRELFQRQLRFKFA